MFATGKQYGVLCGVSEQEVELLIKEFDKFGLLPGIPLQNIYKVSWTTLHGTKYHKFDVVTFEATTEKLPLFAIIQQIWIVHGFVYFHGLILETLEFDPSYQSYCVNKTEQYCYFSYENLVGYNVYHLKKAFDGNLFVPVKYCIKYILEEHLNGQNPLKTHLL